MAKREKVLFIGSKTLGFKILQTIFSISDKYSLEILSIEDQQDARSAYSDIKKFAVINNLPIKIAKNRKESEQMIIDIAPDICIVVCWYWLISEITLNSVPKGFLGIHYSLLPKYRGGSPLIWSLINGESIVGLSLFSFTPGMDDGVIWGQKSLNCEPNSYVEDILGQLEVLAVEVIDENFIDVIKGKIKPDEQIHSNATYCCTRKSDDGKIDWENSSVEVVRFIRAQSVPYPGAFSYLGGKKIIIWRASMFKSPYFGIPGKIARIDSNGIYVICGNNTAILLEEIEIDEIRDKAVNLIKSSKEKFMKNAN